MKLNGRARRRAVWSAVVAGLVAAVIVASALARSSAPAVASAATVKVGRGTVTLAVSASGTVASVQTRGLGFAVSGTVTELNVRAGDMVTANQVLARIDPTGAQDALTLAQQRLADAKDALDQATTTANLPACPTNPAPSAGGGPVGGGQQSASAQPSNASTTASGGTQLAALILTEAAAPSQTCTPAGRSSTNDALLAAQQRYNSAQLAVSRARTQLAGTVIKAPIAGRILSVGGKVGASASAGSAFLELGDVASLTVVAQFSEADVGRLAVGQQASITLPDRDEPAAGKVAQIDPAGTVSNRLVRYGVVIDFNSPPTDLLLGQSATVVVTTSSVENVLYLASAALTGVTDGTGTVIVRSAAGDNPRRVRVGLRGDQYTEIVDGLAEGDEVVLPSGG